jgi:hypothetical protein
VVTADLARLRLALSTVPAQPTAARTIRHP